MRRAALALLFALPAMAQNWPQWGADPQHTQRTSVIGQSLGTNLVDINYDVVVQQEIFGENGELLVHYQAPLIDGNDVYMLTKTGRFDPTTFATQTWAESKYTWQGTSLVKVWDFTTDWTPPGSINDFFEPVFHPVLTRNALYVPGAGGTLFRVDKKTGNGVRINPFTSIDPTVFVVSVLAADVDGNVFYNAVQVPVTNQFYARDVGGAWLIRASADGVAQRVPYASITAGAPLPNDPCQGQFTSEPLPWPPSPNAVPDSAQCGSQRPAMNAAPALAADGTIYVISRAQFNSRDAFIVAVTPDLKPKWIASLRNRLNDGCGVPIAQGGVLPPNGTNGGCRAGARLGVDPATNAPGSGRVNDNGSSSPVVAPDGSIIYGAYTRYNYEQGHLMHFAPDGAFLNAFSFGWDITPAIYVHDATYSVITKDNHYDTGSYCGDPAYCGGERAAGYFITQLDKNLKPEWSFRNTNTASCVRTGYGTLDCTPGAMQEGFEWCVNAFVVDAMGTVYANSEDGWTYAIAQGGWLRGRIFQQLTLGAAYTPTAMDASGRVYTQNAGHLFVTTGQRRRTVR